MISFVTFFTSVIQFYSCGFTIIEDELIDDGDTMNWRCNIDKSIKLSDLWRIGYKSKNPDSIEDNFKIDEPIWPEWCRFCSQEICAQWRPRNNSQKDSQIEGFSAK